MVDEETANVDEETANVDEERSPSLGLGRVPRLDPLIGQPRRVGT
jgi:hypothetical protein